MTVLLGPCPCHGCGAIVTVVRRPVVIRGAGQRCGRDDHTGCATRATSKELREVVTVDRSGVHLCPGVAIERAA